MSKVITFSRTYPVDHLNHKAPTYFVEKILHALGVDYLNYNYLDKLIKLNTKLSIEQLQGFYSSLVDWQRVEEINILPKKHTIRHGQRFKVGEKFSPRVWSGKPYNSFQIIIWEDIEVKNTWEFGLDGFTDEFYFKNLILSGEQMRDKIFLESIAKNDGLTLANFLLWFPFAFNGQIICWNAFIDYQILKYPVT